MADMWNKYANTAARKHGTPGRDKRPKSTTIDAHSHIAFPQVGAFIKPHLDLSTIPLGHFSTDATKALNAKQESDIRECMTSYDARFKIMDEMGVDMQMTMPPPPQLYHTVALEYAVPAARMINDGVAEFVSKHPDRFIPCGTVPMQDGNEAAKELEYLAKTLKFKAVEILTNVAGREFPIPPSRRSGKRPKNWTFWWSSTRTALPRANGCRVSISTTSSAIRSKPRSPFIT